MRPIILLLLFLSGILIHSCGSINKVRMRDFTIKDAYYQSWILNENEKGTDVFVVIRNVGSGIEFRSIIFRGRELPISITKEKGTIVLRAGFTVGVSKLEQKTKVSNKEDQLIYQIGGVNKILILKEIRRKETKYY